MDSAAKSLMLLILRTARWQTKPLFVCIKIIRGVKDLCSDRGPLISCAWEQSSHLHHMLINWFAMDGGDGVCVSCVCIRNINATSRCFNINANKNFLQVRSQYKNWQRKSLYMLHPCASMQWILLLIIRSTISQDPDPKGVPMIPSRSLLAGLSVVGLMMAAVVGTDTHGSLF